MRRPHPVTPPMRIVGAPAQRAPPQRLFPQEAFSPMSPMSPEDDSPFARSPFSSGEGAGDFSSGPPEIGVQEIRRGKLLGKGSFAQVYAGLCRGLPVAVKVLNEHKDALISAHELAKFKEEMAVHQRLYHPHIVLLMGACTSGDKLMIVQELMHKDLEKVLYDPEINLSLPRRVGFGREIALGMNWLHKLDPPTIHRDLKPQNCLLDRELQHVKIADFGLSSILFNDRALLKKSELAPRGTANYLAPEVLTGKELTTAADVYAFGILMWQILTRKHPYEDVGDVSMDEFTDLIVDEESRPDIDDAQRADYPMLVDLIEQCWDARSSSRPSFQDICGVISDALVEIAIPHDTEAQRFWLKFFSAVGSGVKVERVVRALLKWFRLPSNPEMHTAQLKSQLRDLELLLREHEEMDGPSSKSSGRARITAEWFGSIVNWFGPLDKEFLSRVSALCCKPWFHGHLGGAQANRILTGRADGVYLVRFSRTEPGFYTVSATHKNKVTHVRIVHKPCTAEYSVGNGRPVCSSIAELLDTERTALGLSTACPGSMFSAPEEVSGYLSTVFGEAQ